MKNLFIGSIIVLLGMTSNAYAVSLTQEQIAAVLGLLRAFGADQSVIANVELSLTGGVLPPPSAERCHTFNTNLGIGDRGSEVNALVTILKKEGMMSQPAMLIQNDNSFNNSIASAVSKFQEKYRSEILTPNGLAHATGYGGPATRKKLNNLYGCGAGSIQTPPVVIQTNPIEKTTSKVLDTSYNTNVLVLNYFPYSESGKIVDPNLPADYNFGVNTLSYLRKTASNQVQALKAAIEKSSTFHGYKDPSAQTALHYTIFDTKEYLASVPYRKNTNYGPDAHFLDYPKVLSDYSGGFCDLVENKNVSEVWLLGATHAGGFNHAEFILMGSHDLPRPEWEMPDFPVCKKTYKIITHNYERSNLMAHVWGHMLELELRNTDLELADLFLSPCNGTAGYSCHPMDPSFTGTGKTAIMGRCGNVHNPPNARNEYDLMNETPNQSDCKDWKADGLGKLSSISCADWGGCNNYYTSEYDNAEINWQTWLWQNMPGRNNALWYKGKKLRNWWDAHGDYDTLRAQSTGLTVAQF